MHHFKGGQGRGVGVLVPLPPLCRAKWGGCCHCLGWHTLPLPPITISGSPAALVPSSDKPLLSFPQPPPGPSPSEPSGKALTLCEQPAARHGARSRPGSGLALRRELSRSGRVRRRREMGWQGRGLRGDVPLPRCGLFPVTHAACRGDAKGPAPPRVA